jgi:pyruvate dehydrogenase complex dehydrogenase (E1) component
MREGGGWTAATRDVSAAYANVEQWLAAYNNLLRRCGPQRANDLFLRAEVERTNGTSLSDEV